MMVRQIVEEKISSAQRFFTNPTAIVSLLLAIFGQALASIYFQIINNEKQDAAINANMESVKTLREMIYSQQTPLAQRVIKLEDKVEVSTVLLAELRKNLDTIDVMGSRGLGTLNTNQQRLMAQMDRFGERLLMQDKKLGEVDENKRSIVRIEDQQLRIIEALDNLYSEVSKIPPALRAPKSKKQ